MDYTGVVHRPYSRRAFLVGVLGATSAGVLAACSAPAAAPTSAPAAAPTTAPVPTKPAAAASPSTAASPAAGASPAASPAAAASVAPAVKPAASPSAAAASASPSPAVAAQFNVNNPPPVSAANIASAKPYSGQTITYIGDSVGIGNDLDKAAAARFKQDTGITVNVNPKSDDPKSQYNRVFGASADTMDIFMVDVIWPGELAPNLVDLGPKLGDAAQQHYPVIVANDTINGTLVAMPFFSDFGILYYRTDLLQKYNISAPPTTWDQLGQQATTIMNGEKTSNPNFAGVVWQGNAYEGLTCDALEWLASSGGGMIVESGKCTVNNPQAVAILNTIKGWVGTIAPKAVTTYMEDDARNAFQGGNAAFMRNWPYAYSLGNGTGSPVAGKFDVTALPAAAGQSPVGCLGGWALAVSKFSKFPDAAIEFARYLTSPEFQTFRAVVGSFVPTIPSVTNDPAVQQAQPYLTKLASVQRIVRPSAQTDNYDQISTIFYQGVNSVENGQDPASVLPGAQSQITRLLS